MKELLLLAALALVILFAQQAHGALCCGDGCFTGVNLCCGGPQGNATGYVGCEDSNNQFYCPGQTLFLPDSCLQCECTDPWNCNWSANNTICGGTNVCDFSCDPFDNCEQGNIQFPNATQCIAGNCPLCSDCGNGFANICDINECHTECDSGQCFFEYDPFPPIPQCTDCAAAASCSDFDNDPDACNGLISVCDTFSCYYDSGGIDDCRTCDPSLTCADYDDQQTCEAGPCGSANDCWWQNDACEDAPHIKEIQPNPADLVLEQDLSLAVIANFSDSTTIDVTSYSTFVSVNPAIATTTSNSVHGLSPGTTKVTVTFRNDVENVTINVGDPDLDPFYCELGSPGDQGNCSVTGDQWCWDKNAPFGNQCCRAGKSYINAINHSCSESEFFGNQVVYQTDPDDSSTFCGQMSILHNDGVAIGNCNPLEEGNSFCWGTSGFIAQDGACCGDDVGEVWNYSTQFLFENIIVEGTCYNQKWIQRKSYPTTYYDLWVVNI